MVFCPSEQYVDLFFGPIEPGTDFVEFAGTGQGLVFDEYVSDTGKESIDRFNNYRNISVIRQSGTYNFEAFRPAVTWDFTGQDSAIKCGQTNEYSWMVHQRSGAVQLRGTWTLDLDINCEVLNETSVVGETASTEENSEALGAQTLASAASAASLLALSSLALF